MRPPRVNLPFQVIETVNESRATREARRTGVRASLFDVYEGNEGDTFEAGWRNKLIWGDNLLVMGSLLEKFAGKIDLIYIDPPFATGADFSFTAAIGEARSKRPRSSRSSRRRPIGIRGAGASSRTYMLTPRLEIMRELLTPDGVLFLHLGKGVAAVGKLICDEVFGVAIDEITWKRSHAHGDTGQGAKHFGRVTETILVYAKSESYRWHPQYVPYTDEILSRDYKVHRARHRPTIPTHAGRRARRRGEGQSVLRVPWSSRLLALLNGDDARPPRSRRDSPLLHGQVVE